MTVKRKRGRPPRVQKLVESRKVLSRDMVPVFHFAYLWDNMPPRRRHFDRYQEALELVAAEYRITKRTLERRYQLHKPVVTEWRKIWKRNRASRLPPE